MTIKWVKPNTNEYPVTLSQEVHPPFPCKIGLELTEECPLGHIPG